ncbi:MAG: hypothetical protein C0412_02100 [Flavobacterium sp.]|nr:hypothetical protein [Flavobacterium sp.]
MKVYHLFLYTLFFASICISTLYCQWISTKGLANEKILSMANLNSTLFVGTAEKGVFATTDDGDNWTSKNEGIEEQLIMALATSGKSLFAGSYGGVYFSKDYGLSWSETSRECNTPIFCLGVADSSIYAGARDASVFLSTNNGTNWKELAWNSKVYNVREIAIKDNNIFVGTWFYGAFHSSDNGVTWLPVNEGLPENPNFPHLSYPDLYSPVNAIAFSENFIFAGTSFGGIFRSSDKGESWIEVNNGLTDINVTALIRTGANLFAGTNSGKVFLSTNNGSSWTSISTGLENFQITEIKAIGDNIFVGTYGGGVWRRALPEIISNIELEEISASYCLYQNYPNPFNAVTTIKYTIPKTSKVTIIIYDVLGREIVKLIDQEKQPNKYEIKFDGSNLSSGIYFCVMQTFAYSETQKIVLLK